MCQWMELRERGVWGGLHLVSVRTFGIMYDHIFFFQTCRSPDEISNHT